MAAESPKGKRLKWLLKVHDVVNMVVISRLLMLTAGMFADRHENETSRWFLPLAYSTTLYLSLDAIFIWWYSNLFTRALSLVVHHTAAVALVVHAILYPEHERFLLYGMLVELNTFFLTAFKIWKTSVLKWLHLLTWVTLRLGWYPYLVLVYHTEMSSPAYTMFEYGCVLVPHLTVVSLGVFWTLEITTKRSKAMTRGKKI